MRKQTLFNVAATVAFFLSLFLFVEGRMDQDRLAHRVRYLEIGIGEVSDRAEEVEGKVEGMMTADSALTKLDSALVRDVQTLRSFSTRVGAFADYVVEQDPALSQEGFRLFLQKRQQAERAEEPAPRQ